MPANDFAQALQTGLNDAPVGLPIPFDNVQRRASGTDMLCAAEWQYRQMFLQKEYEMNESHQNALPETTEENQNQILSRRAVLRGALLVGCSMIVPIAIFSSPANGAELAATKKVSKTSVKYQNQPKGAQKCNSCVNFISASKTCQRVEGPINPDGWCVLWAKNA